MTGKRFDLPSNSPMLSGKFQCIGCGQIFVKIEDLEKHVQSVHGADDINSLPDHLITLRAAEAIYGGVNDYLDEASKAGSSYGKIVEDGAAAFKTILIKPGKPQPEVEPVLSVFDELRNLSTDRPMPRSLFKG